MSVDKNALYHEAQRLMKMGQPVFPTRAIHVDDTHKAKAPLTKNGLHDATLDKAQVRRWLERSDNVALGLPTGFLWDVLDVDVKAHIDGRRHLSYLQRVGLLNGCQFVVRTPSGGWHLFFKAAQGLTNKAAGPGLGLDVRAKGGYVLAAPSWLRAMNTDDEMYEGYYEVHGETEGHTDDPLWWDLIVSALTPKDINTNREIPLLPSERRSSLAALREWLSDRQAGERNNALHWVVCRAIDNGLDPHELVEPALLIGLTEDETLKTIGSALKRAGVQAEELETEVERMFQQD